MKKIFVSIVAFLLVLLVPMTAFAATYDNVSDWAGLKAAFEDASGDAEVVINITGDITWADFLEVAAGKTFIVKGTGTEVLYAVRFSGSGTVQISEIGKIDDGLRVKEQAKVEVTADVHNDNGDAIKAEGEAKVKVTGNVTASDDGIEAVGDAEVSVTGNITADEDGIYAGEDSNVSVEGNITAGESGINASGDSTVYVKGDVTSVNENSLTPEEMRNPGKYDDGGYGIYAEENAKVTVDGNVTGGEAYGTYGWGGQGIEAYNQANVTVNGDVKGGSVTADPTVQANVGSTARGGDGILMDSTATVTVNGNVTGGNNNGGQKGNAGAAICIDIDSGDKGSVTVNGKAIGGNNSGPDGTDGNAIYVDDLDLDDFFGSAFYTDFEKDLANGTDIRMIVSYTVAVFDAIYNDPNLPIDKAALLAHNDAYMAAVEAYFAGQGLDIAKAADWVGLTGAQKLALAKIAQQYLEGIYTKFASLNNYVGINVQLLAAAGELFGVDAESNGASMDLPQNLKNAILTNSIAYSIVLPQVVGGKVASNAATAKAGEQVTLTATPDAGYEIGFLKVNGVEIAGSNGVYTFTMPVNGAEITYGFTAVNGSTEGDPNEGDTNTKNGVPKTGQAAHGFAGVILLIAAAVIVVLRKKHTEA